MKRRAFAIGAAFAVFGAHEGRAQNQSAASLNAQSLARTKQADKAEIPDGNELFALAQFQEAARIAIKGYEAASAERNVGQLFQANYALNKSLQRQIAHLGAWGPFRARSETDAGFLALRAQAKTLYHQCGRANIFPPEIAKLGWPQYAFDYWRGAGEALITACVGLKDTEHLDLALAALDQARTDAAVKGGDTITNRARDRDVRFFRAQVYGLRGDWRACRTEMAKAPPPELNPKVAETLAAGDVDTSMLTTVPGESSTVNGATMGSLAAMASAQLGLWPEAWRHLQQSRQFAALGPHDQPLAPGCFDHVEAIVALVSTGISSQLWICDKRGGLAGTTRIDLPQLSPFDVDLFMAYGGPGARICPGYMGLSGCQTHADRSETAGQNKAFISALESMDALLQPLFGATLRDAFTLAMSSGPRRIAWAPSAAINQVPIETLSVFAGRGKDAAAVTTAHAFGPFVRQRRPGAADTIGAARVIPIAGGDADIPLAALERQIIERVSTTKNGVSRQSALQVATHSGFDGRSVKIQIAPNRLITVAELARTPYWKPLPRLVVLASCQSNASPASGLDPARISSPAQELIDLGAGGVISTLWPVPDAAAFLFSTALHQRMIVDGTEPLDAFGATKAWLRTSNRTEFARFASRLSASGLIGAADVDLVMAAIDAHGGEKPFAHPHVWANFVYWGV